MFTERTWVDAATLLAPALSFAAWEGALGKQVERPSTSKKYQTFALGLKKQGKTENN